MSIIWWGTRVEAARRGAVADLCPNCREVTAFLVYDHFSVFHVYEIGLGEPRFVGSTRHCNTCQQQFDFDDNLYADVLSVAEVRSLSIAQGVRLTNRRLGALLALADRLKAHTGGPAYRSPSRDESRGLLDEAIKWLEQLIYKGANPGALTEALERWDHLSNDEHARVVSELRRLAAAHGSNRAQG